MMVVDLLRAEALRALRAPLVRGAWVLTLLVPLLILLLAEFALMQPGAATLRFPASIARVGEMLPVVTLVTPSLLMAWLVGVEQTTDTWKLLLVRRPGRVTFLAAKFLVALAVVLALLVAIALVWLPVLEVAGGVAGQPRGVGGVAVEQGLVSLVAAMIVSPALLAVALLLAVVVRRQGTIVGAFSGILCSVLTASIDAGSPTPLLFLMPAQRLAAGLLGSEAHPDLLQLDPLRSAVVLAVWVVGPLAIAGLVFSRRDIESGAA